MPHSRKTSKSSLMNRGGVGDEPGRVPGADVALDVRLPLERVAEACAAIRRNEHFGKIVLTPGRLAV
jgi:hypothetical protein